MATIPTLNRVKLLWQALNFSTFFICHSGIFTVRLIGFGWFMWNFNKVPLTPKARDSMWAVAVFPGWRFAFVAPWI